MLVYLQVEAASCQSAAGKAARVGLLQAEQQRLNGVQLQAEQPKVNVVLQAGAAVVDCITAGGAVGVNCVTTGRSSRGSVRLGSSTVLASSGDSRSSVRSSVLGLSASR